MKRERYIDIVKGLAILCITLLHYESGIMPGNLVRFIGSFMITAFFITSGWLNSMRGKDEPIRMVVKKRFKQLGMPYLYWTAIILAFDLILLLFGYYDTRYIAKEVYKTVMLRGIGTLWFLPALFGGEMLWHCLKGKRWWIIVMMIAATIAYQCLYRYFFVGKEDTLHRIIDTPFRSVYNILWAWISIATGYWFHKIYNARLVNKNGLIVMSCGVLLLALAYVSANHFPASLSPFWTYCAPLIGPFGFLLLFKPIQKYRIFDFLDFWGRNSLCLMVTHYSITMVLCHIIVENRLEVEWSGWITILCFVLSMIPQYLIVAPVNKHCQFLLGK